MTLAKIEMATLYERLAKIGFSRKFIKTKALPDWWEKDCESTPGSVIEGAAYISRRLNLELNSLLDTNTKPRFKNLRQPKFKKQTDTKNKELQVSHCLAARIAELTAHACKTKYQPIDRYSVAEIRSTILSDRQYIDLDGVLNFCWNHGIPVIHFNEFPKGIKKFQGMVACFDITNRPVIVISLKDNSLAKLLFIVLHELGHIYNNHLNGTILIDEKVKLGDSDEEEVEANDFAVELMFGQAYKSYDSYKKFITGEQLSELALNISNNENVDPGSVIMNISWHRYNRATTKDKNVIWSTARKALKIIEGDVNAPVKINTSLKNYLDWTKLNEDNQEYLSSMTGLDIEDVIGE